MKLTITEYAELKGLSRQGVHYQIETGKLKAEKIGNQYVIEHTPYNVYRQATQIRLGLKNALAVVYDWQITYHEGYILTLLADYTTKSALDTLGNTKWKISKQKT